eukprot:gnl/MRDRNA2_/MRDRNA2_93068_c0_seq1.p1 gnl/MRDRNA2_/MRDRNA2_93068_c0~~gnl/MRDRNA2_/MRDRNA2_93068_c0_seq1.p1  ORF type:complete len:301 (+),score=82.62 gnl/MRDRNA2_/MRDRNA2_93068_c0_seq1:48-950(+)
MASTSDAQPPMTAFAHVPENSPGLIDEIFKLLEAACCSSSSMSKERPEGMSTLPQAQGYHNELPDAMPTNTVPGMPSEEKSQESPGQTEDGPQEKHEQGTSVAAQAPTPVAAQALQAPQPPTPVAAQALQAPQAPQFQAMASTAEPDDVEGEVPDASVEEEAQFDTQDLPEQAAGDGLSAEQQKQAKSVIKEFVKEMVRGRKMNVISKGGAVRSCTVSLARKLDSLKLQLGNNTKKIALSEIADIHIGQDGPSIDTPLDDMCCTMALTAGECLTFRFPDVTARDTFAMCMLMFVNGARGN